MPAELLGPAWTVRTGAYGLGRGLGVGYWPVAAHGVDFRPLSVGTFGLLASVTTNAHRRGGIRP